VYWACLQRSLTSGSAFCFPGQHLKGAANKNNLTISSLQTHYLLAQNFLQQAFSCLANQKPDKTHVCKNLNSIYRSNPFSRQQMSNPKTTQPESQHRQCKISKLISFVH
jgi:hypothetical protein